MSIGDRIREVRIKNGMTQSELASKLRCSVKTVSRIEHNAKELTFAETKIINELFHINLFQENCDENSNVSSEQELVAVDSISLSIEDIRLEMNRQWKIKVIIIVGVLSFVVLLAFITLILYLNLQITDKTSESIVVEYIYEERR